MEEKQSCTHCACDSESDESCVSRVPIFSHLEAKIQHIVHHKVRSMTYKKGESIYEANEFSDGLIIVNSGCIRVDRLSDNGKQHLIRILNPGDFTGEMALFKETTHEDYATAMIDTVICKIKREDLQELMNQYPQIALKMLTTFAQRLEEVEKNNARLVNESVDRRISLFLIESMDDNHHVQLSMSKKDLASYLGTTPETLSRTLFEFEDALLIKQHSNRHIEILNIEALSTQ
jgi:CRP/FNR family transcriptional regulator, anaerobic regulatory protein